MDTHAEILRGLRAVRRRWARTPILAVSVLALMAAPAGASTLSSNWAGWVALPASTSSHATFTSVSGSWQVPTVSCTTGQSTYSAVWVGLGGYRANSNALEQVGVDADCSRGGAHYDSWYELIPAGPVSIPIAVHAGDDMTGSVTVRGNHVTLRLRNLTTGARYSITRHASQIDLSSAEWILEAPSSCSANSCQTLPLADFGGVSFSAATATSASHTGPVQDKQWSAQQIELRQGSRSGTARFANGHVLPVSEVIATATPAAGALGGFSVSWTEHQTEGEGRRPRSFGEAVPFGEGAPSGS